MGKSLLLFLSLLAVAHAGSGQTSTKATPAMDCNNQPYRDSLVAKYLDRGAHRFSYMHPSWARYCDSLITKCPNIAEAYQQKAIPLIKGGKYEEAFALEQQAAALDPPKWLAYVGFLKCIFTKDYDGALADFQQARRLKPNGREMDHTYPFFEGLCNLEMGQYKRAEKSFNQDMALQRGASGTGEIHFNTLFYVGTLYLEMKKYELATSYLTKCLLAYPQHPDANYYLALTYRAQGNAALTTKHLLVAQRALLSGYRLNEDNIFYANYPHQITEYEVQQALQ